MLYVQLDANWPDNEKVAEAGWDGAGVHAGIMCIAKRLNGDGWVPARTLRRYEIPAEIVDRLVRLELVEQDEDGRVRVHDWHQRNPTKAAIEAKRAAKVRAAKAGNHKRYEHFGDVDSCRICNPEPEQNASVVAPAIADARTVLAETSQPSRYIERDTGAIAGAIDRPEPDALRRSEEATSDLMAGWQQVRAETGRTRAAS